MKSLDPDINIEDLDRLHAAARYELALHRARMKEDERKEKGEIAPFPPDGEMRPEATLMISTPQKKIVGRDRILATTGKMIRLHRLH